eukprot:GABV01000431.1.p1 GENE.GABV01000431.1~~GABV01000431.1.p1  ORF type:complete len:363 (+),score=157.00 GABV01000431.1:251-1339(+)
MEPDRMLFTGVAGQRVTAGQLKFLAAHGVRLVAVANGEQLARVKKLHGAAEIVVYFVPGIDESSAQAKLTNIFQTATELNLCVAGVGFDVSHMRKTHPVVDFQAALARGVRIARQALHQAETLGHRPWLLHIGDGFIDHDDEEMLREFVAPLIEETLRDWDSRVSPGESRRPLEIVAEPTSFLTGATRWMAMRVIGIDEPPPVEANSNSSAESDTDEAFVMIETSSSVASREDDDEEDEPPPQQPQESKQQQAAVAQQPRIVHLNGPIALLCQQRHQRRLAGRVGVLKADLTVKEAKEEEDSSVDSVLMGSEEDEDECLVPRCEKLPASVAVGDWLFFPIDSAILRGLHDVVELEVHYVVSC